MPTRTDDPLTSPRSPMSPDGTLPGDLDEDRKQNGGGPPMMMGLPRNTSAERRQLPRRGSLALSNTSSSRRQQEGRLAFQAMAQHQYSDSDSLSQGSLAYSAALSALEQKYENTLLDSASAPGGAAMGSTKAQSEAGSMLDSVISGEGDATHHGRVFRFLKRIPFPVWVAVAMLIPVTILVTSEALNLSDVSGQKQYLTEHKVIVALAAYCQDSLMIERGSSTIVLTWNTTAGFNTMHRTRPLTDVRCLQVLDQALGSTDHRLHDEFAVRLRKKLRELYAVRYQIDNHFDITPTSERAFYSSLVDMMDEIWVIISAAAHSKIVTKEMTQLRLIQSASNQLGICRAVGAEIMGLNGTALLEEVLIEFNLCGTEYQDLIRQLRTMSGGNTVFDTDEYKLLALEMIQALMANPRSTLPWSTDYWFSTFSKAINVANLRPDFDSAINKEMLSSSVMITISIVLSATAGVFVMWLQIDAMKRIEDTFARSTMMQQQIAKFVPKSFLKLTGCTSILQVTVGSQTPVAVSMLFSEIHGFAHLSAGMTSETLFMWLEAYLRRMTTITEIHKGFVDKFIGDAIFSVYVAPADALDAGVDMQKETEQLNIDMKCSGGKDLLRIGVGIHHGVASAGFLGDDNRVTATLISKEVNIASRLEGMTKHYGCKVLLSSAAFDGLPIGSYRTRKLGTASMKGCADPVQLVEVFTSDDVEMQEYKIQTLAKWEEGIALREKSEVAESNKLFEQCREIASSFGIRDGACDVKLSHSDTIDRWDEK